MIQTRLFERLREVEGASYSPSAVATSAERFPDWGIVFAASELRPESTDIFFRIARETVADLAAKPAAPDEFARARNPVVSGIERRLKTNAYWLGALENWSREAAQIEQTRTYASDYAGLTAEEVRAAVARYMTDSGDWSMLVLPAKDLGGGH
jgi:zinc protease